MELAEMPDVLLNTHYHNVKDALTLYINSSPPDQWDVEEYTILKKSFQETLQEINRRAEQMHNTG
jgi:hypothetical protein